MRVLSEGIGRVLSEGVGRVLSEGVHVVHSSICPSCDHIPLSIWLSMKLERAVGGRDTSLVPFLEVVAKIHTWLAGPHSNSGVSAPYM